MGCPSLELTSLQRTAFVADIFPLILLKKIYLGRVNVKKSELLFQFNLPAYHLT